MESTEIKPKNIYQKLAEIRKTVKYLKKDNDSFQYKYVSSSQTLGSLASHINDQGLILIPQIIKQEVIEGKNNKGNQQFFTKLEMSFTWINCDNPSEQVICQWSGQGVDDGEKGLGKALTYAEKYFILKFFNIATDKDDPDKFENKYEDKAEKEERLKAEREAKQKAEFEKKQLEAQEKIKLEAEAKRIKAVIESINKCESLDCLSKIRKDNPELEKSNADFKKALGVKYKALTPPKSIDDLAKESLEQSEKVEVKV